MLMYYDLELLTGGMMIFSIIGSIVGFIITVALCVWVYKDAEKHGEQGVVWLLVVLFTGCIGLIIYLIIRNKN